MRRMVFWSIIVILTAFLVSNSFGQLIDYNKRLRRMGLRPGAPQQNTSLAPPGTIDLRVSDPPVNKENKRYDINNDNKLQTAEVKIYLRDVLDEVNRRGSYEVNTEALKMYDTNKDRVITKTEAVAIEKDVR